MPDNNQYLPAYAQMAQLVTATQQSAAALQQIANNGGGSGGSGTDGKPALMYSAVISGTQAPSTGLSLTLPLSGFNRSDITTGETLQAPLYSYDDKSYYLTATVTSVESPNVVVSVVGFVDTTGATGAQGAPGENGENGQDGLPGLSFLYSTADSSTSVPVSSFDTTYGMPIPGDLVAFSNGDVRRVTNVGTAEDSVTLSDVLYSIKGAPYLLYTPVIAGTKVPVQDDELMLDGTGFAFAGDGDYSIVANLPFIAVYQYNNISYLITAVTDGNVEQGAGGTDPFPTTRTTSYGAKIADFVRISGENGSDGATPNISMTATVDDNVGTPSVDVTKSGTDEAPQFNLAFHNLKGASGSGGGGSVPVVNNGTSNTTATIQPNTLYIWGEVTSLNITLATPTDNSILNEYHFFFKSGDTATTLSLPNTVLWDKEPTVIPNCQYEVIIVNNCGKIIPYYDDHDWELAINVTLDEPQQYNTFSGFNYAAVQVLVTVPQTETEFNVLMRTTASSSGQAGRTSTTQSVRFVGNFDSRVSRYAILGKSEGTGWGDTYALLNDTIAVPSRITSMRVDAYQGGQTPVFPAGTIIQIYGKKY